VDLMIPGVRDFRHDRTGLWHTSGTSLDTILLARPSRMAVLPTPGGPMSCGDQRFDTRSQMQPDKAHTPPDLILFALKELASVG